MSSEVLPVIPEVAFVQALQAMLAPNGTGPLFDPAIFAIKLGGDSSIAGSSGQITTPFSKVFLTVSTAYGTETAYMDEGGTTTLDIRIDFTVWGNTGSDMVNTKQLLDFARLKRTAVFEQFGLSLKSDRVNVKRRPYSPVEGIIATDYGYNFFFDSSAVGPQA